MTLYDSSVLIDYLDGLEAAVEFVENNVDQRAVAPSLVLFEVYQGEVYRSGDPDFDAVETALQWVRIVDPPGAPRAAAELQVEHLQRGEPLAARDAFVAGAAKALGERLAVSDSDFAVEGLDEELDVERL